MHTLRLICNSMLFSVLSLCAEETPVIPKIEAKNDPASSVLWELNNLESIGGNKATVEGGPIVVETERGKAISFNGKSDAIFLETNPLEGLAAFTIEVLFKPDSDGPVEQRFVHVQENGTENRCMLETRIPGNGQWYADTYLKHGNSARALVSEKLLHPASQWHTLALVYDGKKMVQYVNGVNELEGKVDF